MTETKANHSRARRGPFWILYLLLPAAVLSGLWVPEIRHFSIEPDIVDAVLVERSRSSPSDSLLGELCQSSYLFDVDQEQLAAETRRVLAGSFTVFADTAAQFTLPFDSDDLLSGTQAKRLASAALYPANVLIDSYNQTGEDSLLLAAGEILAAFADYERSVLLTTGYLRNDHATAARAGVLTKFWRAYRNHSSYDPKMGRVVLELVSRTAAFLAKPSHFQFATNHGVMQNLGLMQLGLAFPELPSSQRYFDLAVDRLEDQFGYYINDEGVVLEHSSEYHAAGLEWLGMIFRCLTLAERPVPPLWRQRYAKALDFYADLRRPDGSLPLIGDTEARIRPRFPARVVEAEDGRIVGLVGACHWPWPRASSFYPVAGYAVWWDGVAERAGAMPLTQTVIGWSYFPGHAHKLADEMAVYLWSEGRDWWTGAGYWLYGTPGRRFAESWDGANSPHLVQENNPDPITGSYNSQRETTVGGYAWTDSVAAIDLQRVGPREYRAIRQVVKLGDSLWVVLDTDVGESGSTSRTVWTASHDLWVRAGNQPDSYVLSGEGSVRTMGASFFGSEGTSITSYAGSTEPFIGWQAYHREAKPTTSIVVERPADNSWSASVWSFHNGPEAVTVETGPPKMQRYENPEDWQLSVPLPSGVVTVTRDRTSVRIKIGADRAPLTLILRHPPDIGAKRRAIRSSFEASASLYPTFRSAISHRAKITMVLLLVILVQESFFFVYRRFARRYYVFLRVLNNLCWVVGGVWLLVFYNIF